MEDGAQTSEMFTSLFQRAEPQTSSGLHGGFVPWHEMPENRQTDPVADVIAATAPGRAPGSGSTGGNEEEKTSGRALNADVTREILSFITTPTNIQYHIGNLANAPDTHFVARPENQLLIHMTRGRWSKPSKRKCVQCKKYFGYVCKSPAGDQLICARCLNVEKPEPVEVDKAASEASVRRRGGGGGMKKHLEAANRRKHKAKIAMIREAFVTNYSPNGIADIVDPHSVASKDLLVMNATKLGKTQTNVFTH